MSEWVVYREYQLKTSETEIVKIVMTIGQPYLDDDGYMWECVFSVEGPGDDWTYNAPGKDSMSAMLTALEVAQGHSRILKNKYGDKITFQNRSNLWTSYQIVFSGLISKAERRIASARIKP
jgi:hypothetical protein